MAEHGFYHPDRGYWQTVSEPPQHILDGYPEGTVEVPLKPGRHYEWGGDEWVYNPPPASSEEEKREQWRGETSVTRVELARGMKREGILDAAQAEEFAAHQLPDPLREMTDGIEDDEVRAEARLLLIGSNDFDRSHEMWAQAPLDAETIDTVFGWVSDEEA